MRKNFWGENAPSVCLVDQPEDEKYSTRRVESSSQQCQDEPGVLRERIAELKRRDENEGSTQCKKQVSRYVSIKRQLPCKGKQDSSNSDKDGAYYAANARAEPVEYCANGKCDDICGYGSDGEHKVEPVKPC